MAGRSKYTPRDERLMWEFLYEELQNGSEDALLPKGNKIWKTFEESGSTDKTAASLTTHFRRHMYEKIETASLPIERLLYVASKIELPLTNKQRRVLENKFDVKIEQNQFTFVTAFTLKGKHYSLPADMERDNDEGNRTPSLVDDSVANDLAVVTEEVQLVREPSVADTCHQSPKKRRRTKLDDSETTSDQSESIAVEENDLNRTNPNLNDVLGMLADIGEIDYDLNRSEHSLINSPNKQTDKRVAQKSPNQNLRSGYITGVSPSQLRRKVVRSGDVAMGDCEELSVTVPRGEDDRITVDVNREVTGEIYAQGEPSYEVVPRDDRLCLNGRRKLHFESSQQSDIQCAPQINEQDVTVTTNVRRTMHSEVFFELMYLRGNDRNRRFRLPDFLSFDGMSLPRVPLRFEKRRIPISCDELNCNSADTILWNELQPVAGPSKESPDKDSHANKRNHANMLDDEGDDAEVSAIRKKANDVVCALRDASEAININGITAINPRIGATEKGLPETTKWLQKRRLYEDVVKLRPPLRPPPVANTSDEITSAHPSNEQANGRQHLSAQEAIRDTLRRNILSLNKYTGIKKLVAITELDRLWLDAQRKNIEFVEYLKEITKTQRSRKASRQLQRSLKMKK